LIILVQIEIIDPKGNRFDHFWQIASAHVIYRAASLAVLLVMAANMYERVLQPASNHVSYETVYIHQISAAWTPKCLIITVLHFCSEIMPFGGLVPNSPQ
jgi:hypothetical protein